MIDIIIADDEKLIREGLKTIINWEEQGFKIVAVARDGDECLDLLKHHKPDACIIDIRMPGKTGLDVIKEIRGDGLNTHFIILSGYKDFGYVKKALTYHADNYLLKPLDEDELIESLNQVKKFIEAEKTAYDPLNIDRLVKTYFRSFLGLSTEKQPDLNPSYINWESYQFLLINLPKESNLKLEEWLSNNNMGIVLSTGVTTTILLKKYYLRSAGIKTINELFSEFLKGKPYDGCLSRSVKNIHELPDALDDVEELFNNRFLSSHSGITSNFYYKPYPKIKYGELDLKSGIQVIQKLIEVGNEQQIALTIHNFSLDMIYEEYNESMIKNWFSELSVAAIMSVVSDNNLPDDRVIGSSELIMIIQGCTRLFELENKLSTILYNAINRQEIQSTETIIKKMKFMVEKHYMDNLKLKDLSDVLNYNSAYLGKLFKTEVGESFSCYLDKYRIERSKDLLQSGLKVYQVAKKVGYSYVDYFHAKFKKYEGISPMEYKTQAEKN
ncbi:MAG: response regulator transcription factor [Spirochaetales bacterium]|nr:response regulator transcription factor [Spirochaetales bacterium]